MDDKGITVHSLAKPVSADDLDAPLNGSYIILLSKRTKSLCSCWFFVIGYVEKYQF